MNGLFWNISAPVAFFCITSPVAASDSPRFPARNFIKKETPAKTFFCECYKVFRNIFWQNTSSYVYYVPPL